MQGGRRGGEGSLPTSFLGPLGELTLGVIEGDQSRASWQRVGDPHFRNQTLGCFLALLNVSSEHQGDCICQEWDLEVGEGRLMQPSRVGEPPPRHRAPSQEENVPRDRCWG